MECIMEIGDKIRYLRRKSNMNQTELAQKLGVVTSTVGFWETGRRQPDLDAIVKISEIFNVSTDYLLNDYNDNTVVILGKAGTHKNIVVSDDQIDLIENFIESLKHNDE